jgi:hypothetical protein
VTDPQDIARFVEDDVKATLEPYFPPAPGRPIAFEAVEDFGDDGTLQARGGDKDYHLVRWRYRGLHVPTRKAREEKGRRAASPTGNSVIVEGLTIVELGPDGGARIHRFVDWLHVYAQLGMVFEGRPIGRTTTEA